MPARVRLIAHTPQPDKIVACAAKLCYSASSAGDVLDGLDEKQTGEFVDMLSDMGHESPFEHASFTFAVEGVSRSLLAQLTRHRIASYSVKSQRYVRELDFSYVTPPEIQAIPEAAALYRRAMEQDQENYSALEEMLFEKHFKQALDAGVPEKQARRTCRKRAIEDARYVLPNACETQLIVTMNVRSLWNFFRLRCCNRAQWEIRDLASQMLDLCRDAAPALFRSAGPGCVAGPCPEGKMSCGKAREMRARFGAKNVENSADEE